MQAWTNQFAARGKGIGFGMTTNGSMSAGFLNTLDLPYVGPFGPKKDPTTLEIKPADSPAEEARFVEFLSGFDSLNACNGDSGGGYFILVEGKRKLAGITSRGISAPTYDAESCAVGTLTTIFGSADVAAEWVKARLPEIFEEAAR
jgi:secreted trypsin-like serine protease